MDAVFTGPNIFHYGLSPPFFSSFVFACIAMCHLLQHTYAFVFKIQSTISEAWLQIGYSKQKRTDKVLYYPASIATSMHYYKSERHCMLPQNSRVPNLWSNHPEIWPAYWVKRITLVIYITWQKKTLCKSRLLSGFVCPNLETRLSSPQAFIVLRSLLPPLNWKFLQLFKNSSRENVKLDCLPKESVKSVTGELQNLTGKDPGQPDPAVMLALQCHMEGGPADIQSD